MTKKRYKLLRGKMFAEDVDQATLGKAIGRSPGYISARFNGRMPFDGNDMYKILDYFRIDHSELPLYFPPGGVVEEN